MAYGKEDFRDYFPEMNSKEEFLAYARSRYISTT